MGYTHYWYVDNFQKELKNFGKVVSDFKKIMPVFEKIGVDLKGGLGEGNPTIDENEIIFNGNSKCGHKERDLGIMWPAKDATGLTAVSRIEEHAEGKLEPIMKDGVATVLIGNPLEWIKHSDVVKTWYAGAEVKGRVCDGDCSHETFALERQHESETDYDKPIEEVSYINSDGTPHYNKKSKVGKCFGFCKTAFKPYDLAVCVALIIAKHHLKGKIKVDSDGTLENWKDAMQICQTFLGYGSDFRLEN